MTIGAVREWHEEAGWGVIDSPETPGGCWAHFSHVDRPGYRTLTPGQRVTLEWQQPGQDGYPYRAVRVRTGDGEGTGLREEASDAYTSTLRLDIDDAGSQTLEP